MIGYASGEVARGFSAGKHSVFRWGLERGAEPLAMRLGTCRYYWASAEALAERAETLPFSDELPPDRQFRQDLLAERAETLPFSDLPCSSPSAARHRLAERAETLPFSDTPFLFRRVCGGILAEPAERLPFSDRTQEREAKHALDVLQSQWEGLLLPTEK